jgi:hypothetical protein
VLDAYDAMLPGANDEMLSKIRRMVEQYRDARWLKDVLSMRDWK